MKKYGMAALCAITLVAVLVCIVLGVKYTDAQKEIAQLTTRLDGFEKTLLSKEQVEHPLDREYKQAMLERSGTTAEGVAIIRSYGDRWNKEMDTYYELLYQELDQDKLNWLIFSQASWELYAKEHAQLRWQTYDQVSHQGSILQIQEAEIYLDRYRTRALQLQELYDFLLHPYYD